MSRTITQPIVGDTGDNGSERLPETCRVFPFDGPVKHKTAYKSNEEDATVERSTQTQRNIRRT